VSAPLNDDGTIPLKRRMQLVLRITGDNPVEVAREVKPLWTAVDSKEATWAIDDKLSRGEDVNPEKIVTDAVSRSLVEVAGEALPGMLNELLHRTGVR